MAFRLFYDLNGNDQVEMNGLDSLDERIARIAIGYDDASGAVYSAVTALCVVPWEPASHMELQFGIVECVNEDEEWHNDGLQTKRFLSGKDREFAFGLLCIATKNLVEKVMPDHITMMTVTPNLPNKALAKYDKLCHVVRALGYEGGRGDPYSGTNIWMLKKACIL